MPTTNPVPSTDPSDLLFNAGKLDEVVNGTANSFTDRLGVSRRTVAGMNADFDAQLADAESDLNVYRADAAASAAEALGYLQTIRATSYGAYASDPATDPLGNPPTVGDEYFNTTANLLKRWNGTTWQASDINTANLAASSGSSLVGYQPAGTGAVPTTVQSKLREMVSVKDFGSSFDSALAAAIAAQRTSGGDLHATPSAYSPSTRPEIVGEFTNGLVVHGDRAVITSGSTSQDGILIGNKVGSVASSYFNKFKLTDFVFVGAGKTGTAAGVRQQAGADIQLQNFRIKNFNVGLSLDGGLTSDFNNINVRDNGIGIKADFFDDGAGGLNSFAPNANTFYGARVFFNDVAVKYLYNPSGAVNWIGSNFEANNSSGNNSDGVKVIELDSAGHHNFIGTHHESNAGQYGIWYKGFDSGKNLLMLGCEVIDAVGTNLHMERGRLTSVGSRITNTTSINDIYLNTGSRATLIDTEASISGDLSYVVAIRDGRIGFGIQPTNISPLIDMQSEPIAASSNIAARFRNDTVQLQWQNTAGTRVAYMQTSASGDHVWHNDNASGGWSFRAGNTARMYIGRSGGNSIEPGGDNTVSCGSGALRFTQVYAVNGTINTSDGREKQDIAALDETEKRVAVAVKGLVKKFRFKDAVQAKGDAARIHVGVIAQEVMAAFKAEGLDPTRYGIICYDEWEDEPEISEPVLDEQGQPTGEVTIVRPYLQAGNRYGIRYEELLAFIIAAL